MRKNWILDTITSAEKKSSFFAKVLMKYSIDWQYGQITTMTYLVHRERHL